MMVDDALHCMIMYDDDADDDDDDDDDDDAGIYAYVLTYMHI